MVGYGFSFNREKFFIGTCMLLLNDMKASGLYPTAKVVLMLSNILIKVIRAQTQVYSLIINACSFGGKLSLAEEVY